MSETPPQHPLFDKAPGRSRGTSTDPAEWFGLATDEERRRLRYLRDRLERRKAGHHDRDTPPFRPFLLVRAQVGDFGERPINYPFWQSPDIWIATGDPAATPAIPSAPGGTVTVGTPHTLYAHVWNLGLAPVIGVTVEFLVFELVIVFGELEMPLPLFRAVTMVDLSSRSAPASCHQLVKCPIAWIPTIVNPTLNAGFESIMVRVSAVGDPLEPLHQWEPSADRKVAQRNIGVTSASDMQLVLERLERSRFASGLLRVVLLGREAADVATLGAPGLRPDLEVTTTVLAELSPDPGGFQRLASLIRDVAPREPGVARVVRIESYEGDQLVGGYSLILSGQY
jgi:hypothetical protein